MAVRNREILSDLIEGIIEKNELLDKMLEYTLLQQEAILNESIEALEDTITEKNKLLSAIEEKNRHLNKKIETLQKDERLGFEQNTEAVLTSDEYLIQLMHHTQEIGRIIHQYEEENIVGVQTLLVKFKKQLLSHEKAKKVEKSYQSDYFPEDASLFFDHKK